MLRNRPAIATAILVLGTCALPSAQALEGYRADELCRRGDLFATAAELSTGELITFDGTEVLRTPADCVSADVSLGTLAVAPTFPSFLVVDPSETFAILGESSFGTIQRVDLVAGGVTPLATLPNNFDAVFEGPGHVLVSAFGVSFNEIVRVDVNTGSTAVLVEVPGPSGPLALEPNGDLVYATSTFDFPAPPGATDILRWSAGKLSPLPSPPLRIQDAELVADGFDSGTDLVVDQASGEIYLSTSDFSSGVNRVWRLGRTPGTSEVIVEGPAFRAINQLEFAPGDGVARFRRFQPGDRAGELRYNSTDFFSTAERLGVTTERPTLTLNGPGATGPGSLDIDLDVGPQDGFVVLTYGPSAGLGPEFGLPLAAAEAPLFFGVFPGVLQELAVLPYDTNGAARAQVQNPGVTGVVLYGVVVNGSLRLAGTTNPATL